MWMLQFLQELDLSQCCHIDTFSLFSYPNLFNSHDIPSSFMCSHNDFTERSLSKDRAFNVCICDSHPCSHHSYRNLAYFNLQPQSSHQKQHSFLLDQFLYISAKTCLFSNISDQVVDIHDVHPTRTTKASTKIK